MGSKYINAMQQKETMKQLRDRLILLREQYDRGARMRGAVAFMHSSPLHYLIMLEVATACLGNKCLNFEGIVKRIPTKYGSRSTINTLLVDYVARGYFGKDVNPGDKRSKVYCATKETLKDLNIMIENSRRMLKVVA